MYAKNALVDAQFVDARNAGSMTPVLAGTYSDEATIDTQLATANAAYYTAARLLTMSINDKIFALRSAVDSAGFVSGGTIVSPAADLTPTPVKAAPAAKKK